MATLSFRVRRTIKALHRRFHEVKMIATGIVSTDHVVQAHIVPIRRCNLSCGYCNEYDDVSKPVPTEEMLARIDHLARLGATLVTISGGEPMLHPDLDQIIARVRKHGILSGLISNGYLMTPDQIKKLNRAGLEHLQISIDNVQPDEVSKKSLKVLDKKLQWLAEYAEFHVTINSVLGSGIKNPEDALVIARRARELGFTSTVGIIHDGSGQLRPLTDYEYSIYTQVKAVGQAHWAQMTSFQENIAKGVPNQWRCRSGARYLYICEDGLVHYCSQQRGYPAIPLAKYTIDDVKREFLTEKSCAPYCTISCAHQTAYMDFWRAPQHLKPAPVPIPQRAPEKLVRIETYSLSE